LLKKSTAAGDTREEELTKAYALLESDLVLIGATAIEDMLQQNVGETIDLMRHAGLHHLRC